MSRATPMTCIIVARVGCTKCGATWDDVSQDAEAAAKAGQVVEAVVNRVCPRQHCGDPNGVVVSCEVEKVPLEAQKAGAK